MLIIVLAVVVAPVLLLGGEALLARRGVALDAPDVTTLSLVSEPDAPRGELRVVWLGDSTAAAVGTSGAQHAVSSVVAESVSEKCQLTVRNEVVAVSGAVVADVLREQLPVARKLDADVALISIGANDVTHLTSLTRFARMYSDVIDGLVASGIEADHIVLVGVPDMGSPPRLAQPLRGVMGWRSRSLDKRVQSLATDKGVRYVDLFAGTSTPIRSDPKRYFAADKYHPSDDGYALWGKTISPVVTPICE